MQRALTTAIALTLLSGVRPLTSGDTTFAARAADGDSVIFAVGDIADCDNMDPSRATARLIEGVAGTILTLGDHAYPKGTLKQFRECYGQTWGRYRSRTRPAIGNHDIIADDGHSYFDYFGERAGPRGLGYYSFDLGAWHVISLNSNNRFSASTGRME